MIKLIVNNIGIKIFSLALAIALAAYVYLYSNYQITQVLLLPLQVKNLAGTLLVANELPASMQVRIRGPFRTIRQLSQRRLFAYVDCAAYSKPVNEAVRIQVPEPGDASVISQELDYVDLQLELKSEKALPVSIERRGEPALDYQVTSEELSAKTVQISGPASLVNSAEQAVVQPDVSGLKEDRHLRLPVLLYTSGGALVQGYALSLTPRELEYSVSLAPLGAIKVLKVIPDFDGQPERGYLLGEPLPRPLYVPIDAALVPRDLEYLRTAPIDLSGATKSFSTEVRLIYPFQVPPKAGLPGTCDVYVEIIPLAEQGRDSLHLAIGLDGTDQRYEYVVSPPEVVLESSELLLLEEAKRRELRAALNVTQLKPGEYRLAPQLFLPLKLERVTMVPATVTLTIIQHGD